MCSSNTLPLCILLWLWSIVFMLLMFDLLSTNHCVAAAIILLPLTLPQWMLHLYCNSFSNAASAMLLALPLLTLHLYCNLVAERSNKKKNTQTGQVSNGYCLVLKSWLLLVPFCLWSHYASEALHYASLHCCLLALCCSVSGSPSQCICRINTPWHQLKLHHPATPDHGLP